MTKFFFSQVVVFFLIISVISRISVTDAQRCQKVLDPTGCTLQQCQSDCFKMFQNFRGVGKCIRNNNNNTYECMCIYDCHAKPKFV
ncbi:hypothetical protein PHAVU_010G002400 [Phaseolus vulgaris]|uniref:Knottin scorpion toxin-like domain-containing protein n=1 Tax=Phaseolus vulgaris TaxID=3885 RepID=V7AK38_PHAVU|nr:hypothetical protein PHAVU_010G002400g [Phaseolus vulgaris]ESW05904.1 hypothetical protein PHAVU_010G002400g [Phaseolus vulgaris]